MLEPRSGTTALWFSLCVLGLGNAWGGAATGRAVRVRRRFATTYIRTHTHTHTHTLIKQVVVVPGPVRRLSPRHRVLVLR